MTERSFDICVIGAGPAGATGALLLARAGMSVAIVEKAAFPRRKVCGEYLSATTLDLFGKLGLLDEFTELAGPEISRVAIFADEKIMTAPMPRNKPPQSRFGRALRRDVLDEWLLMNAADAGATVFQPFSVTGITKSGDKHSIQIESKDANGSIVINARNIIAAHGSWEIGHLPTQAKKQKPDGRDLLGFKAHFRNTALPAELMPMLVFPGGYGGMATCDDGFVSISCCVRRDTLQEVRKRFPEKKAGEAVQQHITSTTKGVRDVIGNADLCGEWLSAGPIRPGFRLRARDGIFVVGNAAGESHPIIAEGISMAIQSSWLLSQWLLNGPGGSFDEISAAYDRDWLAAFGPRIKAANVFAYLALNGRGHAAMAATLAKYPSLLTAGARLSGKVNRIAVSQISV